MEIFNLIFAWKGLKTTKLKKKKKSFSSINLQQICNKKESIHAITLNFSQNN